MIAHIIDGETSAQCVGEEVIAGVADLKTASPDVKYPAPCRESVPVVNAAKMYQTVKEYGHYPIDVDRIRARRTDLRKNCELKLRAHLAL